MFFFCVTIARKIKKYGKEEKELSVGINVYALLNTHVYQEKNGSQMDT